MAASIWNPNGPVSVPELPAVAPVTFVKGTVGNPGINFVGDTETGIWSQADGYLNFTVNGVNVLTIDSSGNIIANKFASGAEIDVASAAVTDIGSQLSNTVRITGANNITSFGTVYRGPIFVRFASALTLTYNASTLILPGAANISISAGDTLIAIPKATASVSDGWYVVGYSSPAPLLNAVTNITGVATGMIISNVTSINGGQIAGMRNKIINGKMEIAQRGTSFAAAGSGYHLDRWQFGADTSAVVTVSQQNDAPTNTGFQNSLRYAVTTADTSLSASDYFLVSQIIEGYNVRDLVGKPFTISFWVRSSNTGIHCLSFRNAGPDRSYIAEYTVNAANTWEYKTITITGGLPSVGTWNYSNGLGLGVSFILAAGSNCQTTAGAWQTGNFQATANQVNCLDTIGNIFAITGVQLEVGSVATPFEHRPYGMELALCQRYYEKTQATIGASVIYSASAAWLSWKVTKRANPTVTTIPDAGSGGLYTAFGHDGAYQSSTNSVGCGATITASSEL